MFEKVTLPPNSPIGVIRYTLYPDGRDKIEVLNKVITEIWGFPKEEIESDPSIIWNNIDPEYIKDIQNSFTESAESMTSYSQAYYYNSPDGQTKWIEGNGCPTLLEDKSIVWFSTLQDRTNLKLAEKEVGKLKIRYATLLNSVHDGIVIINEDYEIISFNNSAETLFGFKMSEIIGRNINVLIPAQYHGSHPVDLDRFKQSEIKSKMMGEFRKVEGVKKDGSKFPVKVSIGRAIYGDEIAFIAVVKPILEDAESLINKLHHDAVESLNGANLMLSLIQLNHEKLSDEEIENKIGNIIKSINNTIEDIQNLKKII